MEYLLKSTICLSAFYGLYFFGFRRMSFHALNRSYLLVSLAFSLTIPLLSYERTEVVVLEPQAIEEVNIPVEEMQESAVNQSKTIQPIKSIEEIPVRTIDWIQVLNSIYLLGVGVMIFVFTKNLLIILYTIKKASTSVTLTNSTEAERIRSHSSSNRKLKILLTRSQSNSSFFNYIFLNPANLNPHEEALIIAHEGFHAQRLHTLDLLILGILKAVFWFNPIVYFYQKSLKQIHEYEVDALMSATYDGREYAHLLLKLGVAPNAMIINQFSTKPLSERFQFLFKTPTKNMKKLLYFLSLPIIAVGVMAFAEEKVNTIYKQKNNNTPLQPIEVKEYPLVINDEKNRASWNNSFNSLRFSPANISLNKIQIKNYNGFHYYVNPNSLTINMIEQVNKFIGMRFLALIITEKEFDDKGNLSKLGLALQHLRTNQVSQPEVFNMTELREKGKNGAFFIIEGYDKNFKNSEILFNEGSKDLTITWGNKDIIYTINQTSDLSIAQKRIIYKVSPDKFNLITFENVKAYFAKEGFTLISKNEVFDKNHNLISLTIQIDNGKEKSEKQVVLNDLRHLIRLKTESKDNAHRWDEALVIEANKDTKKVKVDYEGKWFEGIKKSNKYEITEVVVNDIRKQIDSTKFTYYLSVKPTKKGNIDSFKVIVKNQLLVEGRDFIVKGEGIYLDQKYKGTRPSFHVYSTVMGPVLYPYLTKLDNIPLININLSAKLPSFFASSDNRVLSKTIKIPFPDTRPIKSQDTLRTILEANKLGKNPLVFINDIEYPSSILYRINPNSMRGSEIYSKGSQRAIEKYGLRAEDGVIILNTTKNKELLLGNEKQYRIAVDNVKKQLDAPKKRVQRVVLKDSDGKEYEKISVMRPDLVTIHFSVDVPVGGKIIFTVDGKVVNEEDIENTRQIYIGGGCGQTHGEKYDAYIDLNTK